MGDDPRTDGAPALTIAAGDAARIREQIEATRSELGDTVAALAAKTDVRQQARERFAATRRRAVERKQALLQRADDASPGASERASRLGRSASAQASAHPLPLIATGAVALGFVLGRLTAG